MDGWLPKGGPAPGGGPSADGAFERFLTAAIATIITIMFSWRLLDDMNDAAVVEQTEREGGDAQSNQQTPFASSSKPTIAATTHQCVADIEIDEESRTQTLAHTVDVDVDAEEREPPQVTEQDVTDCDVGMESFLLSMDNSAGFSAYTMHQEVSEIVGDDCQPRELDSDEDLFCCSLLEPIIEEDSDDIYSSSDDHESLQQQNSCSHNSSMCDERPLHDAVRSCVHDEETDFSAAGSFVAQTVEAGDSDSDESVETIVVVHSEGSAESSPQHDSCVYQASDSGQLAGSFPLFQQLHQKEQDVPDKDSFTSNTCLPPNLTVVGTKADDYIFDETVADRRNPDSAMTAPCKISVRRAISSDSVSEIDSEECGSENNSQEKGNDGPKLSAVCNQSVKHADIFNDAELSSGKEETPYGCILAIKQEAFYTSTVQDVFKDARISSGTEKMPNVPAVSNAFQDPHISSETEGIPNVPAVSTAFRGPHVLPETEDIPKPSAVSDTLKDTHISSKTEDTPKALTMLDAFKDAHMSSGTEEMPKASAMPDVCTDAHILLEAQDIPKTSTVPDISKEIEDDPETPTAVPATFKDAHISSGTEDMPKGYTFTRWESEACRWEQRIFLVDGPLASDFESLISHVPFTSEGSIRDRETSLGNDEYSIFVKELFVSAAPERPNYVRTTDDGDGCILSGNLITSPTSDSVPPPAHFQFPAVSSIGRDLTTGKWSREQTNIPMKETSDNAETSGLSYSKTESSDGLLDVSFDIDSQDKDANGKFAFVQEGETLACPLTAPQQNNLSDSATKTVAFVQEGETLACESAMKTIAFIKEGKTKVCPSTVEEQQSSLTESALKTIALQEGETLACPSMVEEQKPSLTESTRKTIALQEGETLACPITTEGQESGLTESVMKIGDLRDKYYEAEIEKDKPFELSYLDKDDERIEPELTITSAASVSAAKLNTDSSVDTFEADESVKSKQECVPVSQPKPKPRRLSSLTDGAQKENVPVPVARTRIRDDVFETHPEKQDQITAARQQTPVSSTPSSELPHLDCSGSSSDGKDGDISIEDDYCYSSPSMKQLPLPEKRPRSLKEIKRKLTQQRAASQAYHHPTISPFIVPDHIVTPSRLKILASRKRFFSSDSLTYDGNDSYHEQFAAYKIGDHQLPLQQHRYKSPNRPLSTSSTFSGQEQLEKIQDMINWSRHSQSSLDRPPIEHLHDDCIFSPQGRRNILDKTMSIENIHLSLPEHVGNYSTGTGMSVIGTNLDSGELQTNYFPETNIDIFDVLFQSHQPLQRSASMSDVLVGAVGGGGGEEGAGEVESTYSVRHPPRKTGKDRFMMHRFNKKSKSLCTLETNMDELPTVEEDNLKRVPSVHELRVTKSLQKLNVPDWFKQSSLSKSSSCLLKYGSNSTMNSFSFSPSLVSSPCASTAPPATNVVIKTRVVPPSTARSFRYTSFGTAATSSERKPPSSTPVKLPSDRFRDKEKQKNLMPIPIVPFAKIRAMFENKTKIDKKPQHKVDGTEIKKVTHPATAAVPVISVTGEDGVHGGGENHRARLEKKACEVVTGPEILPAPSVDKTDSSSQEVRAAKHSHAVNETHEKYERGNNSVTYAVQKPTPVTSEAKSAFPASVAVTNGDKKAPAPVSAPQKHGSEHYQKPGDAKNITPHKGTKLYSPTKSVKSFFGFSKDKHPEPSQSGQSSAPFTGDAVYESEPRRRGVSASGSGRRTFSEDSKTSKHSDVSVPSLSRNIEASSSHEKQAHGNAAKARFFPSMSESPAKQDRLMARTEEHPSSASFPKAVDRTVSPKSENGDWHEERDRKLPGTSPEVKPGENRSLKETTV